MAPTYLQVKTNSCNRGEHYFTHTHTQPVSDEVRLIPELLKDWWAVIDIPDLDDDSCAGLHAGHAQGMNYQEVGCRLLSKQNQDTE